jgi:DNA-binding transcriptional regulator YdaS (Cro superfamily)
MATKQKSRHKSLLAWLKIATPDQIEKTGVTKEHLRLVGYGHKNASPEVAAMTELASEGAVTRKELFPNVWKRIWPELAAA